MTTKSCPKVAHSHHCESCDYTTCKLSSWKKHIQTIKHKKREMTTNDNKMTTKSCPKVAQTFHCNCGKEYANRSNLSRHKRICKKLLGTENLAIKNTPTPAAQPTNVTERSVIEVMGKLLDQNQVMMQMLAESGHHNTTHTNSHNKTFNISFFLNEHCKNALSIQDFAKSLQLDLQRNSGLICGDPSLITEIISKKLGGLPQIDRPLHTHEEKWYVKDQQDGWEGDQSGKAIDVLSREVAKEDLAKIPGQYPNWADSNHPDSARYAEAVAKTTRDLTLRDKRKIMRDLENTCVVK